ncbi:MAG: sugar nucleotide-binding protein [Treponema sp.]|nr:sugar nucleotide-binding protein [Treponema sp.]
MKPKVNIIGVEGFIGSYLYKDLQASCIINGTYFNHKTETANLYLDITKHDILQDVLSQFDDSIVILLSASKDVKKCEESYEFAYQINTQPVQSIIEIIEKNRLDIKFIFFSSDYVFEGTTGYYSVDSSLNPKTNYGRTKAAAEGLLKSSKIDFRIVRTSAVMGYGSPFFTWLTNAIKEGEDIELFDNVFFTPTPINFLSEIIMNVIADYNDSPLSVPSILHIVGECRLSRFEFAQSIASILQKNGHLLPIEKNLSIDTFQHDLSMEQSIYVKKLQKKCFHEYLELLL